MDQPPVYDHDPNPPPRPVETWSALALRNRHGEFLSDRSGYRVYPARSPFTAHCWAHLVELEEWLEPKSNRFRVSLDAEGYRAVRLMLTVADVPLACPVAAPGPPARPIVAEASTDA